MSSRPARTQPWPQPPARPRKRLRVTGNSRVHPLPVRPDRRPTGIVHQDVLANLALRTALHAQAAVSIALQGIAVNVVVDSVVRPIAAKPNAGARAVRDGVEAEDVAAASRVESGRLGKSFTEVADGGKNLFGAPTPQDLMSAAAANSSESDKVSTRLKKLGQQSASPSQASRRGDTPGT
jgi:hypothetical protein